MKSCKSHEKNETKNIRPLVFSFSPINLAFWCFCFVFHVVCKISNFNKWAAKHLAQASWTELTLKKNIYRLLRSASHRIQFCESCEPLTEVAEPEVDDLAAAIPEARALKELPPNMVFDLSLSLPIMRKYRWNLLLKGNG